MITCCFSAEDKLDPLAAAVEDVAATILFSLSFSGSRLILVEDGKKDGPRISHPTAVSSQTPDTDQTRSDNESKENGRFKLPHPPFLMAALFGAAAQSCQTNLGSVQYERTNDSVYVQVERDRHGQLAHVYQRLPATTKYPCVGQKYMLNFIA